MAKKILAVPEQYLADVIRVIRSGLRNTGSTVNPEVVEQLTNWCDDEEEYLKRIAGEEDRR